MIPGVYCAAAAAPATMCSSYSYLSLRVLDFDIWPWDLPLDRTWGSCQQREKKQYFKCFSSKVFTSSSKPAWWLESFNPSALSKKSYHNMTFFDDVCCRIALPLGGDLARLCAFSIEQESASVILEVPEAGSKSTVDSEKCSLRQLLTELEDEGITDATVNGHDLRRPGADAENGPRPSKLSLASGSSNNVWTERFKHWIKRLKVLSASNRRLPQCSSNGTVWILPSMRMWLLTLLLQPFVN